MTNQTQLLSTSQPVKPAGRQKKAVKPAPAPEGPTYGVKSRPRYAPGIRRFAETPGGGTPSDAPLRFEELPILPFGAEITGGGVKMRRMANDRARELLTRGAPYSPAELDTLRAFSGGGGLQGESLTAFYTPARLALYVWELLLAVSEQSPRTALEPSCGTGVFLHAAPSGLQVTGVEIDPESAQIAQILNPHAHVHALPFEAFTTQSADPFVDVVIGNVPFGDRGRLSQERGLERRDEERHEWFFLNSALSRVKPGGLVALIVPEDLVREAKWQARREQLLTRAGVVGAVAVPAGTFRATGAGVMTSILLLRRHDQGVEEGLMALSPDERLKMMDGLHARPQNFVDGQMHFVRKPDSDRFITTGLTLAAPGAAVTASRYGDPEVDGQPVLTQDRLARHAAVLKDHRDCAITRAALLAAVRTHLGAEGEARVQQAMQQARAHPIPQGFLSRDGLFRFSHGKWQHADAVNTPEAQAALALSRELRAERLTSVRSPNREGLTARLASFDTDGRQAERLRRLSARFPLLHLALTPPPVPEQEAPVTLLPGDVIDVSEQLADLNALTLRALRSTCWNTAEECEAHLLAHFRFSGDAFSQRWLRKSDADFGHAYDRAADLREKARTWPGDDARHQALLIQADDFEQRALAQWKGLAESDLTPRDLLVSIPCLEQWISSFLSLQGERVGAILVSRERGLVNLRLRNTFNDAITSADRHAIDDGVIRALESYLNYSTKRDSVTRQNKSREEIRAQEAAALKRANRYEKGLEAHFRSWVVTSDFAQELEDTYNRTRNATLTAPEDIRSLKLPFWAGPDLHLYQRRDVRTLAAWGHGILNYGVGLGKTFTSLALGSLLKLRREARVPMLVTPLSLVGNWVTNIRVARPDWRMLSIGMTATGELDEFGDPTYREDSGAERQAKLASLISDPPDFTVISLETFTGIPMNHETLIALIEEDADVMAQAKQAAADSFDSGQRRFGGHKQAATFESEVGDMLERSRVSSGTDITFEMLGVDCLIFEEAHKLKNLWSAPQYLGEVPKFMGAGLESQRALSAYHKARYVRQQHGGRGTYSLTATPWKNSPLEVMYALSLVTDDLRGLGLTTPLSFMLRYCVIEPRVITSPDGEVSLRSCVVDFKNLKELESVLRLHVIEDDAVNCRMDHRIGLPLPNQEFVVHRVALSREQEAAYAGYRADAASPAKKGDKHLFAILARMEHAAIDPVGAGIGGPNPRADLAAQLAFDEHRQGLGTVTFLDKGGDADDGAFGVYKAAYVAAGIPAEQIEVVTAKSHPNSASRLKVELRFRRGLIRHVIGGSTIREGLNLNHLAGAVIHLDQPHDPEDKTQRNGRAWRQGNDAPHVKIHDVLQVGSSDMLRYTNLMGKAGWLAALKSGQDRATNHAAFDAVSTAVLLAADPEAALRAIQEKMGELTAEAGRLEERSRWGTLRAFSEAILLTRQRWEKAQGREHGPSRQDEAGLERLKGQLVTLAAQVAGLPQEMRRVLTLLCRPGWVSDVPLSPGVQFTVDSRATTFREVQGANILTSTRAYSAEELLEAHTVTLPADAARYGDSLIALLPSGIRAEVQATLDAAPVLSEPARVDVPVTQEVTRVLPASSAPNVPVVQETQAAADVTWADLPALPDVKAPAAPQQRLLPPAPRAAPAPQERRIPLIPMRLPERFALAARRSSDGAAQVYRIEGDTLVLVPHGTAPHGDEVLLALYERQGELHTAALVAATRFEAVQGGLLQQPAGAYSRVTQLLRHTAV